jgi:hypothetical protein
MNVRGVRFTSLLTITSKNLEYKQTFASKENIHPKCNEPSQEGRPTIPGTRIKAYWSDSLKHSNKLIYAHDYAHVCELVYEHSL